MTIFRKHEKSLFLLAKKGDIEAFEELVEPYFKRVFGVALKVSQNSNEASELAQEVFVRVYKSIKYVKDELLLPTYIYRTTIEVCCLPLLWFNGK